MKKVVLPKSLSGKADPQALRVRLRKLLAAKSIIRAPGVVDALSAKLVEAAGFEAVYVTGGGISRSMGFPDVGVVTMSEMVERVRLVAHATTLPVIADADAGYGNAINLIRTVGEFEDTGVAAIHLEDQRTPKRCGHYDGKELISEEEMVLKIEAAIAARRDANLVIIVRTDARAVEGLDGALRRATAYAAAGADVLFFEAPASIDEIKIMVESVNLPLLINMFAGGNTPLLSTGELEAIGCCIVIFPSQLQRASIKAMQRTLALLKADKMSDGENPELMVSFRERERIVGLSEITVLEERFLKFTKPK